jgi:hypothetical protein
VAFALTILKGTRMHLEFLASLGIIQKNGHPAHPQTQGKINVRDPMSSGTAFPPFIGLCGSIAARWISTSQETSLVPCVPTPGSRCDLVTNHSGRMGSADLSYAFSPAK